MEYILKNARVYENGNLCMDASEYDIRKSRVREIVSRTMGAPMKAIEENEMCDFKTLTPDLKCILYGEKEINEIVDVAAKIISRGINTAFGVYE